MEVCQKSSDAVRRSQEEEITCLREDMEVLLALRAQCNICIRKNIHLLHHNTGIKSTTDSHMYSLTNTQLNHQSSQLAQPVAAPLSHSNQKQVSSSLSNSTTAATPTPTSTSLWPSFNLFSYFFSSTSSSSSSAGSAHSLTSSTDIQRV